MQKSKVNILVAQLAYGGNGGVATVLPQLVPWFAHRHLWLKQDERIGQVAFKTYGDIPLSMERNRIVKEAIAGGFDLILMLDSDNLPDLYVGKEGGAKPFLESSFDFVYDRLCRGVPSVVCAPYCGPPPHPTNGGGENVYVFYAEADEGQDEGAPNPNIRFKAYSREHAAIMRGIQPIAAGPTGVILYTTSSLELIPKRQPLREILQDVQAGSLGVERAKQLIEMRSWFYYEFEDGEESAKASTEDCTNTREIQLAGIAKHGEPIVFCNWDSWAGHYKPKCVGKPNPLRIESVSQVYAEAVRNNVSIDDAQVEIDLPDLPPREVASPNVSVSQGVPERVARKTMIFEKVFDHVTLDEAECMSIVDNSCKRQWYRCVVVGDLTGEVSWSVFRAFADARPWGDVSIYRTACERDVLPVMPDDIRTLQPGVTPQSLDKQDLDLVVIQARGRSKQDVVADIIGWKGHLVSGGRIVVAGLPYADAENYVLNGDYCLSMAQSVSAEDFECDGACIVFDSDAWEDDHVARDV